MKSRAERFIAHSGAEHLVRRVRGREDERLVDGILLHVYWLLAENRDDAARHVAVELVVGRAEAQLAGRFAVLELKVGRTHRDAERLELV